MIGVLILILLGFFNWFLYAHTGVDGYLIGVGFSGGLTIALIDSLVD